MNRLLSGTLLCAGLAWGQIGTSTITERVTDETGAVVPKVQVTVVQIATNFTFTAVTNSEGLYRVQSLQPGQYRVTFEAAGFRRLIREEIDLRTGDVLASHGALQVGSVTVRRKLRRLLRQSPRLNPGLREAVVEAYRDAAKEAGVETRLPPATFPDRCPFTAEQILDPDFLP